MARCRGAENNEWVVGVEEDGQLGVHGDIAVDRSGSGMLDGGWNFSWVGDCQVISWRKCRVWWSYDLSWFSRWYMVRSYLEWWEKILVKGRWCS